MSRTRALPALALAAATLAACAGGPGAPMGPRGPVGPAEFHPSDFAWSQAPGRNRIDGRLVYRQGQTRFTCSGSGVVLTPETPWTRRRMSILYASATAAALPADEVRARTPSAPNADYSGFVRTTTCDSANRFSFAGLPDGSWFVIAMARPAAGSGPSMAIMRRVVTRGGRPVALDL
ncbi:hypothetical protein ACFSC0_02970 [Phenylobacterium terrae]|uniref:Lipoprotein n=1 Tax=Phenylobacterium terrae TaxID=2665495 RepID=A0ABW4MX48_9CAUL